MRIPESTLNVGPTRHSPLVLSVEFDRRRNIRAFIELELERWHALFRDQAVDGDIERLAQLFE